MSSCPFCGDHIWGEGRDPKTGKRFYSHVSPLQSTRCAYELVRSTDGSWSKMLLCSSAALPEAIETSKDSRLYMQGFEDGQAMGRVSAELQAKAERAALAAHWEDSANS